MKRLLFATATLSLVALAFAHSPAAAQAGSNTYAIDPGESSAEFKVVHLVVSNVRGRIPIVSGSVTLSGNATVPEAIQATLDASALDTGNPDRDGDLKGSNWLEVSKYPTIVFKSTKVAPGQGGSFTVTGDLTLHGVTKSLVLDCKTVGAGLDPRGRRKIGYSATATLDRRDYGLNFARTTPGGDLVVGTSVAISLEIEVASN
jgi:polyisoprenoid-binding protein YceI